MKISPPHSDSLMMQWTRWKWITMKRGWLSPTLKSFPDLPRGNRIKTASAIIDNLFGVISRRDHTAVGGLVTCIAEHFSLELHERKVIGRVAHLDVKMLEYIGALTREAGTHNWMVSTTEKLHFPNPSFIDLSVTTNVKMQHVDFPEQPEQIPQEQPQEEQVPAEQQQSLARPSDSDPSASDVHRKLELMRVEHAATQARVEELELGPSHLCHSSCLPHALGCHS
ncbi:GPI transamidase subunit PIG-U [Striga asiatica]|uniref:GPI transamidase subunit PIG-U n=1 Tax=Striga asiatica TaxID=4170 RepID=A0A5A7P0Q3_STRAF|nr:GPI transamidase subunit PIG-U [Striga asiatica]